MKLHVSEVLDVLERKPIILSGDTTSDITVAEKNHPMRKRVLPTLLTDIRTAQKFIFDSGMDADEDTVSAFRDTAVNMLEAKLFHMPHPLCWIEDPYESDNPDDRARNYYLVKETATKITIFFFQRMDQGRMPGIPGGVPEVIWHTNPLVIDLAQPTDNFFVPTASGYDFATQKAWGEAVYSVKKFVVTLAARNTVLERVERTRNPTTGRSSPAYNIVRIPLQTSEPSEGEGSGTGPRGKRRFHLVRGFIWGKNTRPKEEQRWVAPYWRGDKELGTIEREHYEVH